MIPEEKNLWKIQIYRPDNPREKCLETRFIDPKILGNKNLKKLFLTDQMTMGKNSLEIHTCGYDNWQVILNPSSWKKKLKKKIQIYGPDDP